MFLSTLCLAGLWFGEYKSVWTLCILRFCALYFCRMYYLPSVVVV